MCICAYMHAYIHASWILDLLCWILFVFFHWIFECSVSEAFLVQSKQPFYCSIISTVCLPICRDCSMPRRGLPFGKDLKH